MTWSSQLRKALSRNVAHMAYGLRYTGYGLGLSAYTWTTRATGEGAVLPILAGPPRFDGGSVTPQAWTSGSGSCDVELQGTEAQLRTAITSLTRGASMEILAGVGGQPSASWERIWVGQLVSAQVKGRRIRLRLADQVAALRCRLTTDVDEVSLFSNAGNASVLAAAYTPGDGTLYVNPSSVFEFESGGTGVVRIQPTTGDAFYLTYSGTATGPGRLIGLSGTGQFGTTAVAAALADPAVNIAYVYGHPIICALKIFQAGSTGTYAGLPATWGFGLGDDEVDIDDAEAWRAVAAVSSGSYAWHILLDAPVTNASSWMRQLWARAGFWPVLRQGRLSMRCAQDLGSADLKVVDLGITDDDLIDWSLDLWSASTSAQYQLARIYTATSSGWVTGGSVTSLPCGDELPYDCSTVVWSNETAVQNEVSNRLGPWASRVPAVLNLTAPTLRLSQLVPGDVVPVTSVASQIWSRLEATLGGYLDGAHGLVTRVRADHPQWQTALSLELLPTWSGLWPSES